jgi:hypothetical protein
MKLLALFLLLCSHLPLFWPCIRAIRNGRLPKSIDLVGLSFLLYFDAEIAFEAFGGRYTSEIFRPMFSSDTLGVTLVLLLVTPWAAKLGYHMVNDLAGAPGEKTTTRLHHSRVFYALSLGICSALAIVSLVLVTSTSAIWNARSFLEKYLGVWIIIFYIPTGVLGFYACQSESRTRWGKVYTLVLMFLAMLAIAPVGERILVLTPVLIVLFFSMKPSLARFAGVASALIVAGVLLMYLMKGPQQKSLSDIAYDVFAADFGRGPILAASTAESSPVGSALLPYPGAGYVYSVLFYVPRSLLPFKGYATAAVFTGKLYNQRAQDLTWSLATSAIDELAVNFGWLAVPLGIFIYGACFAVVDLASLRVPVFKVSSLLSAIWVMGYPLPTLVSVFGTISVFGALCHIVFTKPKHVVHGTARMGSPWLQIKL